MATQQVTATTNAADTAIQFALAQVGKPYRWGATGPDAYDCSGLVQTAYAHAGIKLPRVTYSQVLVGTAVDRNALLPGDIIFPNPGHEQLYIGGGKVCEAPEAGVPVRVVPIWGFWKARRVTSPGTAASGGPSTTAPGSTFTSGSSGLNTLDAFSWITTSHNWLRVGEFVAGTGLVFVGLKTLGS